MEKTYWFKAKHYGWGWYPATWHGWAVTFMAVVAIISVAQWADVASHSTRDTLLLSIIPTIIIVGILIMIAYLTGEKPQWRWGKK